MYQYLADDQLQQLRTTHQERLYVLELQAADHDPSRVPMGLINEIAHYRRQITAIDAEVERRQRQPAAPKAPRRCPGCTSDVPYGQQECSHCGTRLHF